MITSKENQRIKKYAAGYVADVTAYKAALAAAGLPLCSTAEELATAYRTKLFAPLLDSDKGLQARWDMVKTKSAQVEFIKAYIDVDGHTELTHAQALQDDLRGKYRNVTFNVGGVLSGVTFEQFAQLWEMDLYKAIDAHTVDLSNQHDIVAFFGALSTTFTALRDIFFAAGYLSTNADLHDVLRLIERSYENHNWKEPLGIKEMAVWHLSNALTHAGKRGMIPQA